MVSACSQQYRISEEEYEEAFSAESLSFDFMAQGNKMTYSYFFENKKLKKFEITVKENDYSLVWNFYDYGKTQIPEWAGKN